MPVIVEFPTIVKEALDAFGDLFANQPEREHLAEYLTGLMVADRKNVSAISRQFAAAPDQSCLNRWLTEVRWDAEELNRRRLDWLQEDPSTRYGERGVIPIDNVLIDHDGKLIEDAGYFWDHGRRGDHKVAHDYLIADYVCTSGKHYPLEFRRFVSPCRVAERLGDKREQCELKGAEFRDHNELFRELVDWAVGSEIPGDFTFDCWFTHAGNLNHVHRHGRGYVGDLKFNRNVVFQGRTLKAQELAAQIKPQDRKPIEVDGDKQWYFTKSIRIDGVDHPVRVVILWEQWNSKQARKILVTNRTYWEVGRVLRVYRHRWRGTECFHRDGKQHLGMGDCQLRKGRGQTRHMYLVFLAHSLSPCRVAKRHGDLMRHLRQSRACEWALERLTTIGQACRAVLRQTLGQTIDWVVERVRDGWDDRKIKGHLAIM